MACIVQPHTHIHLRIHAFLCIAQHMLYPIAATGLALLNARHDIPLLASLRFLHLSCKIQAQCIEATA